MNAVFSMRNSDSRFDNRKPVLSFAEGSAIHNPTWMSIAIVLTLFFGDAAASAQQAEKIFRIGFLDPSTASGTAVVVEAFRQELSKLDGLRKKTSPSSTGLQKTKVLSAYPSFRRSWFISGLI